MLENKIKMYKLGIIAPRNFTDIKILRSMLDDKVDKISHIVTNDVDAGGDTVQKYAKEKNLSYTVYPIFKKIGGALISNSRIIEGSDFIYIFDDGYSDNAKNAKQECEKRTKKFKIVSFKEFIPSL